ncbi:hypothetical protein B0H14DRAFT_2590589 [Mycena olivaceomarginata]|nr:hypothetical protein B0H14DRAFT_2590589 [Mycena olivaceomarginata]
MSILNSEVPYSQIGRDVLKPASVAMVQHQIHKWPRNFSASKTTVARLRQVLSDPKTGFTNAVASVQKPRSPSPSLSIDSDLEVQRVKLLIEDAGGPVMLAIRNREYQDYCVYFVKVTDNALLEETSPSPEFAVILSDNCLEIFVEQAEGTYFHANPAYTDVTWLSTEIKGLPGYEDYVNHRCKVQQNAGVAASWELITLVPRTYFGQPSHITGGRRTKKIKKKSSTSLAEAENAARILKRYGEGGTDPAQAEINRVWTTEAKPKGAKVLYPFLVEWERAHNWCQITTATKEFDPQHPYLQVGAAGDACAEKEHKNPACRESDTEEADVFVKFCGMRVGRTHSRVSAGQKKGYSLMVPKKAMAAASYAVATTKVESQCPHLSGGVGGDTEC